MPILSSFYPSSGKQNVMASFNNYLVSQIGGGTVHNGIDTTLPLGKTFWWTFGYPLTALMFPSITVSETGLYTPGETAIGRVLAIDKVTGLPIKGTRNQTLIEINCWAKDTAALANAEKVVRDLRDKVMYVLNNAAEFDESTNSLLLPPIELKDYNQAIPPTVGLIYLDRSPNAVNEKFIVDSADQNIKRYRLLVRIYWNELV